MKWKLLSLCTLVAMSWVSPLKAETMKVCYDQWPPMTIFPDANEPRRGVVIDMLSMIYKSEGIALEFIEVPYARGMQMVADGQCDMLPEKEYSPIAGKGYVYAENETYQYETAFVVRRDDPWVYSGIESIRGKRVATGPGWDYSSMSEPYQAYLVDPLNQDDVEVLAGHGNVVDRILSMIDQGRVDLYADNVFVLEYLLSINGLSEKLKVVTPGLEKKLVEKPIFSLKLDAERRARLIKTWDDGRANMPPLTEAAILKSYGVELPVH